GPSVDQYPAGRAHRRRARPHLSAALRTGPLRGVARRNPSVPLLGAIPQPGRRGRRADPPLLSTRRPDASSGRPAFHGRRRDDGFGLLAVAAQTGGPSVQRLLSPSHAPEQSPTAPAHFA